MKTIEAVKERPILFSTPMVQAIMEGRKTVTRRVKAGKCTLDQIIPGEYGNEKPNVQYSTWFDEDDGVERGPEWIAIFEDDDFCYPLGQYPGQVGDILWVRETFMYSDVKCTWDNELPSQVQVLYKASNDLRPDGISIEEFGCAKWINVTSEKAEQIECDIEDQEQEGDRWKPSIHMMKEACRIKLKIVSITVERLNDITEEDAIREGVQFYEAEILGKRYRDYIADASGYGHPDYDFPSVQTARESFQTLWIKINGKESWEANPWVWRIGFSKIDSAILNTPTPELK